VRPVGLVELAGLDDPMGLGELAGICAGGPSQTVRPSLATGPSVVGLNDPVGTGSWRA
jgi:hypothetical protein